jgi:hypothetical protein
MNKNAIKKFAIDARNKLIASVTDKAGMLGITKDTCSEPITKGVDFEVYKTTAGTEVTLNKKQCEHRRKLVEQIKTSGFDAVIEEVAYTWFNRICAIRFMEVNDYMYPARVRVLSSEKAGKNEPDILTLAPDIDWEFTEEEREYIIDAKMNNKLDDLFRMLFIKQCNLLHEVLPGLFEETEDYTEMLLNISFTNEDDVIRMLVDGINESDFDITTVDENGKQAGQVEIIGWLYQYYNTEPKNKAFAKKGKITKEEVPAVTQLFTPDWIVRYMVENSLGRLWVEGHPDADLQGKWKYYLEEAEQESEVQAEIAKIHEEYAKLKPEDIKLIDPCMGSGHILVYAFDVFMQIYENAGWSAREAAQSIVENNIYGLDIDDRAAQLSYFAVMMKARQYDRRIFTRGVRPNVYAIQESNGINRNQLKYFGSELGEMERKTAIFQIEGLLDTLVDAKEYGSILNVDVYDWDLLRRFISDTDVDGQISFDTYGLDETANKLKELIEIGAIMAQKYEVVATNPPYASTGNLSIKINNFIKKYYPDSKTDLYAVFIEKCSKFTRVNCFQSMITQHSWMSLSSYESLRLKLTGMSIVNMAHLGPRAFEEISGEMVQATSFVIQKVKLPYRKGTYCRLVEFTTPADKERAFLSKNARFYAKQENYNRIPGAPVSAYVASETLASLYEQGKTISEIGEVKIGMGTGNNDLFLKLWWEIKYLDIDFSITGINEIDMYSKKFYPYSKGGERRRWYGNHEFIVWFDKDGQKCMKQTSGHRENGGIDYYFHKGMTWSYSTMAAFSVRVMPSGFVFDVNGSSLFLNEENYNYVLCFLQSCVGRFVIDSTKSAFSVQAGTIRNLPILGKSTLEIESLADECISLTKDDWDVFETSWDFKRHPLLSVIPRNSVLFDDTDDIDLAECYTCWEIECNERFNQLKANEEELNRIFIDIYGLQEELTPEVEEKDVTVRKADLQRDIKSLISYAVGCMFGRYSLNEEGLIYAGGEWDNSKYTTFIPDKDNIIPITDEEYFEGDIVTRFCDWLKTAFGTKSFDTNMDFIANELGNKGDTSREVIRNYFLNDFFKDHCNTYSVTGSGKRPIYWLFDSGKQNGFKALIYMHRYDADTVGRVRTDYLHKAQKYVETAMQSAQYTLDNASSSSEKSKATKSITKYTKQLAEMQIYDEAIAHIANQRIEIDLDDGVKVNYAKFQGVEVAQEGKKALKVDLLAKI